MATFIEEGLLHVANRDWFWPKGLMLTAAQWINEGERYRSVVQPLIRGALGTAEVQKALHESTDFIHLMALDELAEAIFTAMAATMEGVAAEGLILRQYDPAEAVQSSLPDGGAARRVRFDAWWADRRRALALCEACDREEGDEWHDPGSHAYRHAFRPIP